MWMSHEITVPFRLVLAVVVTAWALKSQRIMDQFEHGQADKKEIAIAVWDLVDAIIEEGEKRNAPDTTDAVDDADNAG